MSSCIKFSRVHFKFATFSCVKHFTPGQWPSQLRRYQKSQCPCFVFRWYRVWNSDQRLALM